MAGWLAGGRPAGRFRPDDSSCFSPLSNHHTWGPGPTLFFTRVSWRAHVCPTSAVVCRYPNSQSTVTSWTRLDATSFLSNRCQRCERTKSRVEAEEIDYMTFKLFRWHLSVKTLEFGSWNHIIFHKYYLIVKTASYIPSRKYKVYIGR